MNKIVVKNIALSMRKQLMDGIGNKVKENGLNVLVEETAYMWFIRLISIRFMEVNKYISCNLKDGMLNKSTFVNLCNYLAETMPTVFEKIEDNMYILLPDNMFGQKSIVMDLVEAIEERYWKMDICEEEKREVDEYGIEIIGWLHQYYFSMKKDEIFSELKKGKLTKSNIPTATQIFTPKWIVRYMVENSLGRIWLESHPNERLLSKWKYFVKNIEEESKVNKLLEVLIKENLNPEEIRVLDPAMGSGHILAYAFDVLYDIYLSYGYKKEKIPLLILEKNLYGLDIDDRVSKLASFAILMKARSKDSEILNYNPKLNLVSIQESNEISEEIVDYLISTNKTICEESIYKKDIEYLVKVFQNAKEYGALLDIESIDFDGLENVLKEIRLAPEIGLLDPLHCEIILAKLPAIIKQGRIMSQKYDVVVANPPYSGLRKFNSTLKKFVENHYLDYKYDLFSVFMIKNMNLTRDNGITGFMTPNVWQFISSYENLRNHIINNYQLLSLIQLESDGFKDASVSISTFVIRKSTNSIKSTFIKLDKEDGSQAKRVEAKISKESKNKFYVDQSVFKRIAGSKIAFWIKENTIKSFEKGKRLEELGKPRQGMATSDNNRFLRYWYEVNSEDIYFSNENSGIGNYKWVPYNKGGGNRKWYGNNNFIINWQNDGYEVKKYAKSLYGNYTRTIKNEDFYFKEGITYAFIGKDIAPRYSPKGFIFDVAGSMIFVDNDKLYYILGLLASKLSKHYMDFLNPSLNIQVGDIKSIPVVETLDFNLLKYIDNLVLENISISKNDWDSFEISWDYKKHPLLNYKFKGETIKQRYEGWTIFAKQQFNKLKVNEEKLNSIFIDIYGIREELTPEVEDRYISIRNANELREIKSLISYAVGCMFGRYSLDEEGLIYAGGSFEEKFKFDNEKCYIKIKETWMPSSISVVSINKIPIFENGILNDIVDRFVDFINIAFGEEKLEYNLNYIANTLYKKSKKTYKEIIKHYFENDFFINHLQMYHKRPIYLLDKDKETGCKYLIYIHRDKD